MNKFAKMTTQQLAIAILIMMSIVVGSNILVQYPINPWLTWGALSYPISFLVTDLLNRRFGPKQARHVVYIGFASAVIISIWLANWRIAVASGSAFLLAQLTDISIFDKLRDKKWWRAPFIGGALAAVVDTVAFFSIAFAGTDMPWTTLLFGDLAVKLIVNMLMLAPFRALMWNLGRPVSNGIRD